MLIHIFRLIKYLLIEVLPLISFYRLKAYEKSSSANVFWVIQIGCQYFMRNHMKPGLIFIILHQKKHCRVFRALYINNYTDHAAIWLIKVKLCILVLILCSLPLCVKNKLKYPLKIVFALFWI
jgi:hypothetical protein